MHGLKYPKFYEFMEKWSLLTFTCVTEAAPGFFLVDSMQAAY